MKISYVVHQFLPEHHAGTEMFTCDLIREMKKRGHEISLLTFSHNPQRKSPLFGQIDDVWEDIPVVRLLFDVGYATNPLLFCRIRSPVIGAPRNPRRPNETGRPSPKNFMFNVWGRHLCECR